MASLHSPFQVVFERPIDRITITDENGSVSSGPRISNRFLLQGLQHLPHAQSFWLKYKREMEPKDDEKTHRLFYVVDIENPGTVYEVWCDVFCVAKQCRLKPFDFVRASFEPQALERLITNVYTISQAIYDMLPSLSLYLEQNGHTFVPKESVEPL